MYHRAGSDAYRQQHGLLTTAELDRLRRNLGMTWKQFAEFVGIGIATLKRWMGGEIQTPAYNSLVRLRADLRFAEQATNDLIVRLTENSGCAQQTVEVAVSPGVRRGRSRVDRVSVGVDAQYGLAA